VFSAFARDLVKHVERGLTLEKCDANKQWLREIAALASGLPDSELWGKKIYERCDAVTNEYEHWNSPEGNPASRDKYLGRIKNKINKLAGTYRKRTALLEEKADIKMYLAFYKATEKLVNIVPDLLGEVAKILVKYSKDTAT
jgi:hypothetical protein